MRDFLCHFIDQRSLRAALLLAATCHAPLPAQETTGSARSVASDRAWWRADDSITPSLAPGGTEVRSVYVVMRDGVRLAVDVYLPPVRRGRLPAILEQTRYHRAQDLVATRQTQPPSGLGAFVAAGYAVVVADVRGSGASFGTRRSEFSPEERQDGVQLLDWIVQQEWSSGVVGATGMSYPGTAAEFLGASGHPALRAIAPRFSLFDFYEDVLAPGGIFLARFFEAWANTVNDLDRNSVPPARAGVTRGVRPADIDSGGRLLRAAVAEHAGNRSIFEAARTVRFRDDTTGDGWSPDDLATASVAGTIARAGIPVYSYSGWSDGGFGRSAVSRFRAIRTPGSRLTLGPWNHGGRWLYEPGRPPHPSRYDHSGELLRFFDYHLKGVATGIERENAVHYYTTGSNEWKSASSWPPTGVQWVRWYLSAGLTLSTTRPVASDTTFAVDTSLGTGPWSRWNTILGGGPVGYDDRAAVAEKAAAFLSAPFDTGLTVTGEVRAQLAVTVDDSSARMHVYLEDVDEQGRVGLVTEGWLAMRHTMPSSGGARFTRLGDRAPRPGERTTVELTLLPVSHHFKTGHRLRLTISGTDRDQTDPASNRHVRFHLDGTSVVMLPVEGVPHRNQH